MSTWADVRRLALSLPETSESTTHGGASWLVKDKLFAWERPLRKNDLAALGLEKQPWPVLGVRTPDLEMKEVLLARDPIVYFTIPHFDGYAAVLVRLNKIKIAELRALLREAWTARAPKRVLTAAGKRT